MTASSSTRARQRDLEHIEAYLVGLPDAPQRALRRIRDAVRAAAPGAEEAFVYGVPGFKLNGKPLVCYASFKRHCGFYPLSPTVIAAHASELERYQISKGTIRFQAEKPLPKSLVTKLVRARAAELRG